MKAAVLFLLSVMASAQPGVILPGDPCFQGGQVWPSPVVEWNPSFTCTLNLSSGLYVISYSFIEPSGVAPGGRVFTVSQAGQSSPPIDIAKSGVVPLVIRAKVLLAFDGPLVMTFRATVRNAVVSSISIAPVWAVI